MSEDLISSGRLDGLHSSAVVALLGEPDPKKTVRVSGDMVYRLGMAFPVDDWWLAIDLDDQGKVAEYGFKMD